jgi:hypothetical protein
MNLDILLRIGPKPDYNRPEGVRVVQQDAIETFAKMRELQKKLGVDDDTLLSAAELSVEHMKQLITKYDAALRGATEAGNPPAQPEQVTPIPEMLTLTRSISIQLPYGNVVLPAGTKMQLVARNGDNVQVRHMDAEYEIPISATDL